MSFNKTTEHALKAALQTIPLGGLRLFDTLGSTNDEALAWASAGAKDFSLVLADRQTAGRGRMGRRWFTSAGAALAFSLILRPRSTERALVPLFSGLGALALADALKQNGLSPQIKWPNDVLLNNKKIAGILVEAVWLGDEADSIVLGMGVNVTSESIPPADDLTFPATSIQSEAQFSISRFDLLKQTLAALLAWRQRLGSDEFISQWEASLAFRGEMIQVWSGEGEVLHGRLLGLEPDGSLRVQAQAGSVQVIRFGEVHLRPL